MSKFFKRIGTKAHKYQVYVTFEKVKMDLNFPC